MILVKTFVFPVVMYGCESWSLTAESKRKINSFEMWCWRRMLRISWMDYRTNNSIVAELALTSTLLQRVNEQCLRYFGHICRRDGENLEKVILQGRVPGKRRRGRPKMRYGDTVRLLGGFATIGDATRATSDRERWRAIVRSARP